MVSFREAALRVKNLVLKKRLERLQIVNMGMENELSFLHHELIEAHATIASLRQAAAAEAAARRASATERQRRWRQGRGRGFARVVCLRLLSAAKPHEDLFWDLATQRVQEDSSCQLKLLLQFRRRVLPLAYSCPAHGVRT